MLKNLFSKHKINKIILQNIEFTIEHKVRKNMKRFILRVEEKNCIKVSSYKSSFKSIKNFILENEEWIVQRHLSIKEPLSENSIFYYLNQQYKIKHHLDSLSFKKQIVYLHPQKAKKQTDDFYKQKAKELLPQRVDYWKEKMSLGFNELKFRLTKTRWGSCNSKKVITLNPYLMKLSFEMIDYVIVHELAHLRHMNHSKQFYSLVENYIKNYIVIQKEIKQFSLKI